MLDLGLENQIYSDLLTQFAEDILESKKMTEQGKKNKLIHQMPDT